MKTINSNFIEDKVIKDMVEEDKNFNNYVEYRENHYKNYRNEHADVYQYLNKKQPEMNGSNPLLEQFFNTENETLNDIKDSCHGSKTLSYIMSKQVIKEYENMLENEFKELSEQQNKSNNDTATKEQKEQFKQALNKNKLKMSLAVRKSSNKLKNELKKSENAMKIISKMNSGNDSSMKNETKQNFEQVMKLYELIKNNPNIEKIMELVGKMQNRAEHNLNTSTDNGNGAICGIKSGNNLEMLLPEELVMMDLPEFKELKELDFMNKNLLQFKQKGSEPKNKGNCIVCLDESYSMKGYKIQESYAYLFGLYIVSQRKNQKMKLIKFGGVEQTETIEITGIDSLITIVNNFMGSGNTDFNSPLTETIKAIESDKDYTEADVIFITDGCGRVKESIINEFKELKNNIKLKMITFLMDGVCNEKLESISDKVINSNDFENLTNETFK